MSRLNVKTNAPAKATPAPLVVTATAPDAVTHEGGKGYKRDQRSELFLTAVTRFHGEDTFYEKAADRGDRFAQLCRAVAVADPQWFGQFVAWLRGGGNIRTASIVAAAEGANAMRKGKKTGVRELVKSALVRADEPGEFIAYWRANIAKTLPGGVQRGVADAAAVLYTERNVIKWDSAAKAYRFADVVELAHPSPESPAQAALFKYLLDERHHGDGNLDGLLVLTAYRAAQEALKTDRAAFLAAATTNPDVLSKSGLTWENLSSSGAMDAAAWTAIVPTMGYMATIRNLRNLEQAGVSEAVRKQVAKKIADPAEVARSRQLPYRFLSAYLNAQHSDWGPALEKALQHCLVNIPELPGKTCVLVDTSGSMTGSNMSANSKISPMMAGALFGVALAAKNNSAALYGFADGPRAFRHDVVQGSNVLRETEKFVARVGTDGYGTNIEAALRKAYGENPDAARFVIVTDMQCAEGHIGRVVPKTIPIYAYDLGGYSATSMASTHNRYQFGSLSDSAFALIRAIEAAEQGRWPWENQG